MSIITAYKSDEDGKIFEDKSKYTAHLRKLARHRNAQRRLQVDENLKDQIWGSLYECEQSIEQWFDMVIANQDLFWAEAAAGDRQAARCGRQQQGEEADDQERGAGKPCPP